MGVLGLTPFLQKTCPEVIKQIPERLRGLAGKKVVIDGTLITQRLHFAQAPHPYRHVLGWYRLVKELNEAGVAAACVFDGKERNIAKAREAQRRKEVQRQTTARGVLEQERSKRLRRLFNILHQFGDFGQDIRVRAVKLLGEPCVANQQVVDKLSVTKLIGTQLTGSWRQPSRGSKASQSLSPRTFRFPLDSISDEALESTSEDGRLSLFSAAHDAQYYALELDSSLFESSTFDTPSSYTCQQTAAELPVDADLDILTHVSSVHADEQDHERLSDPDLPPDQPTPLPSTPIHHTLDDEDGLLKELVALYDNYRQSILKLTSLATPFNSSSMPSVREPDTQAEIALTKAQYHIMLEEGSFWNNLFAPGEGTPKFALDATLEQLSSTSEMMSASFERRMNPPTAQTYQECKEILQAMGVPCLDASGAFEAEALASSIVLNGLADYVASEDTDVVIYEAPLLRNLTSRNIPLTLVSGAEIRTVLQLDRTSFLDFALLLGTDFSQRIKNVGPARALKFIREHGSIERVIEAETKYLPRISNQAYLAQVQIARAVFRTLPPVPEANLLEQRTIDEAAVIEILQKYGLGRAITDNEAWDYTTVLEGNYFNDDPSAI